MGVELHITRADFWAENERKEISADEWLTYVAADPELQLEPTNGKYQVLWLGKSSYDEPWLDWFQGSVHTKWPDTALYQKMLQVAAALNAQVMDDEGHVYHGQTEWEFEP